MLLKKKSSAMRGLEGWDGYTILSRIFREGISEEVIFKQRQETSEGGSHTNIWGKSFPGRGPCNQGAARTPAQVISSHPCPI